MTELYERDDLPGLIGSAQRQRERTISAWNAGELDDETFRREQGADRLLLQALEDSLAIREGRSQPTPAYRVRVRAAGDAARLSATWRGMDDELRELLGGDG